MALEVGITLLPVLPGILGFPADQQQNLFVILTLFIQGDTDINQPRHFLKCAWCAEFFNDLGAVSFFNYDGSCLN
ncbi:hypothetical protein D3C71_2023170 [compost metagenome]